MLRLPEALERLLAALDGVDRLVLLGDVVELRGGPLASALAAARPVFEALAQKLDGRELILVPGNHDHALLAPWLERRIEPLGAEQFADPADASDAAAELLAPIEGARLAYPGFWVAEHVYATHGHYLDVHVTVPSFERLAVGALARARGSRTAQVRTADDHEALLAPIYAWIHSAAQQGSRYANGGGGARAWKALTAATGRRRSLRELALGAGFSAAVGALNRAGLGPLRRELSPAEIRRASLQAFGEVLEGLEVEAAHAVFGHTHRTGPLDGQLEGWSTPAGTRLHNTGSWVFETHFMANAKPANPYWPGGAVLVDGGAPPRGLRLLGDLTAQELAGGRPASKQTP